MNGCLCTFSGQDIVQLFGVLAFITSTMTSLHVALNRELFMEYRVFM